MLPSYKRQLLVRKECLINGQIELEIRSLYWKKPLQYLRLFCFRYNKVIMQNKNKNAIVKYSTFQTIIFCKIISYIYIYYKELNKKN